MRNKTRIIRQLLLIALTFNAGMAAAQQHGKPITITGRVVDSLSGAAVAFSTVAITDREMKPVAAAAADTDGKFSVKIKAAGSYKLIVSYVGYTPLVREIELKEETGKLDLGKVAIKAGISMGTVEMVAQRPLITADPDKMTYSVEADPESEYGTLAEIIRKVPQLSVDGEDNVKLNGRSDYKVLVNGKSSSLWSKNFKEVIKSMPANSIKNIEVITNPSTKYESEGAGGIINIITKKRTIDGYSGSASIGVGSFGSYNANAYISAQTGKFSMSANYYYNRSGNPSTTSFSETTRYGDDPTIEKITGEGGGHYTGHNLSLESSYEIDTFNLITLSVWGYLGGNRSNSFSNRRKSDMEGNIIEKYERKDDMKYSYGYLSGNIDYQRTFQKPDRSLTASYRIEYDPQESSQTTEIEGPAPLMRKSDNRAAGSEHTLQVDYYDPITKKHNMEVGVKYILRLNTSETEAAIREGMAWIPDNSNMNDLDYTQHIAGLYGGYLFKHNKFTAKAGFRAEGTINIGTAKTIDGGINFDNKIFNVVPYTNISYMLSASQKLAFSFTQRLRRPGIWHLNPYVDRTQPGSISYGNPDLEATVSNSFSLNWSLFKNSWNIYVGGGGSFANNSIMSYTRSSGDILETTYYNMGKEQRYNLSVSYGYRYKAILNVYASLNGSYSIIDGDLSKLPDATGGRPLRNEGFNYGGNLGASTSLWKNARVSMNFGIYSSSINLQGRGSSYHYSSVSLSQRLLKERLTLSLSVSNPFTPYQVYSNETNLEGSFKSVSEYRYRSRRITFNIGFRFGKMDINVKKARRGISNDDVMSGEKGGKQ